MNKLYELTRLLSYAGTILLTMYVGIKPGFGQDEDTGKLPVKSTFAAGLLIETPTIITPYKNALEMHIQHRFSTMTNGISDLFGIYGGANTRIAMDYGVTDRIMVGFGTTMYSKLQDFEWKVSILKQNRGGSIPFSISYFGNGVIDARGVEYFPPRATYRFIHRLSYLTEFIFARKFNDILSLQIAPQFAYYNSVDSLHKNINYGIMFGGRAKFWESKSILFEYDQPLTNPIGNYKPNLTVGVEIGTATHVFQVILTNYQNIVGQQNLVYNTYNPFTRNFTKNYLFGFNIIVRF